MGVGRFHFSDRYSVFDWGEMPDHIEGKGEALCLMGAFCFERLEEKGIKTHYRGLVDSDGKVVKFKNLKHASSSMEVSLVNVYKPETHLEQGKLTYDYSVYTPKLKNCLIPLEIIYRNGLPEGSSVFKRLEQGKTTLKDLGLDHYPKPGERFAKPLFDVSTKLEQTDRYVTWEEAKKIAGLTNIELIAVKSVLSKVDDTISEMACHAKLENEDGKIELAFDEERELMVVDVVGTLDECRFTYRGISREQGNRQAILQENKLVRGCGGSQESRRSQRRHKIGRRCASRSLRNSTLKLKTFISQMYMAAANELTNRRHFDVPALAKIINEYKKQKE